MRNKNETKRMAKIMKALSNPNRLELFLEIANSTSERCYEAGCECECFITDIVKHMKIGAPTISHHLKELANAGLIVTERNGKFLVARVNNEVVNDIREILKSVCQD